MTITEPNGRILVVDDNPAIHEDFRKILCPGKTVNAILEEDLSAVLGDAPQSDRQDIFEIDSAFQGREALAMVQAALEAGRPYAMAFIDVRMPPGWDGVETITHIWKTYPQLQVVICTAYSDYSWDEMMKQLGQSDNLVILKKPFDTIEVLQLAHALTRKWFLFRQATIKFDDLDHLVQERTRESTSANAKLLREMAVREQAEAALRLSEKRFKKAFEANPLAMAIQTLKEERYVDVNESFTKLTGLPRAELVGHTPPELPVILSEATRNSVRRELAASQRVRNLACPLLLPAGITLDAILWVELFDTGAETLMLLIIQDVSERVQLEAQLRQSQKHEAVGLLAAGVAHDFNNLLTVIQGHASLRLSCDNLDQEIRESLQAMSTAADRAAQLTRQLLAFGRKQALRRTRVDLNQLIANLHHMMCRLLGEHITLVWNPPGEPPEVYADASQLEQVLMNLMLNARDAMPDGGTITLSTEVSTVDPSCVHGHADAREGRFVLLSVRDTGCGMDAATQERLFEPFFTTKDVGKGTGMGLAMVYGIVKQHEGWVEVVSQVKQGSTFKIFLPVSRGNEPKVESASKTQTLNPTPTRGSERILVVEDEPAVKKLVSAILRKAGYRVVVANDGIEALDLWKREEGNFQLLLTDNVMPNGMSGRQLAHILQAENARLKVIISTGYSSESSDISGDLRQGFNLLPKPYVPQTLLQTVRAHLDG